jgi:predicted nuclease of restriction endonuclease-like (RecB) superfamily
MASSEPAQPEGAESAAALAEAKTLVQSARTRAVLAANNELIGLYWRLGHLLLNRQVADGWGTKVVERLSRGLRADFAGMRGLSPTNLDYMRRFAAAWPGVGIPPQVVGRLPWGHVRGMRRPSRSADEGSMAQRRVELA